MKKVSKWKIDSSWTLFLDRDGTINERVAGYVTTWEDFKFLPNSLEAINGFSNIFSKIIVVTNQQGIGKDLMTIDQLHHIHTLMLEVIDYYDGRIDEIYFEPSLAYLESPRRKPNIGMALDAKQDFPQIDFKKSIMIGDTLSDMEFGKKLGMKTVWIENNMEILNKNLILSKSDVVVGGMKEFLSLVID